MKSKTKMKLKINFNKLLCQILFLGFIITICFSSYQIYHMPFFLISGVDYASDNKDLVLAPISLNQPMGKNIFEFHNEILISSIYENPEVENVKIFRKLPSKLEIDVKKRIPFLIIKNYNSFALIDKNGFCIQQSESVRKSHAERYDCREIFVPCRWYETLCGECRRLRFCVSGFFYILPCGCRRRPRIREYAVRRRADRGDGRR